MSEHWRQLDTEDLEQASDLGLEIDALFADCSGTGEQHADVVACHALDAHLAVPATAQLVGDASRIMLIRLVAHRTERCLDLLSLDPSRIVMLSPNVCLPLQSRRS